MEKKELRRLIRQRKSLLTPQRQAMAAEALLRQLSEDERYAHAHCLLLYASLPDEVPTLRLLEQASARHRIVLPCVTGPSTMELREYTGAADLSIGAFGIPEPTGCLFTHLSDIELALIPGMAFDAAGHRLGRGKGYYDRFLAQTQMQSVRKWGVCYDFQLLDPIPTDAHAQPGERVLIC